MSNAPKDVSAPVARDTGATGETRNVGNGEFLLAVFGADLADARPLVVSFEGDPGSGPEKRWCGLPWQSESGIFPSLPATVNNYFCLATFRPDGAGQFAAAELAWRLEAERRAVEIVIPSEIGHDFADELEASRDA